MNRGYDTNKAMLRATILVGVLAAGCGPKRVTTPVVETVEQGFGLARQTAIRVCGPGGERDYLAGLRCPSGEPPSYVRAGSVGARNPGEQELSVMMDMNAKLPEGAVDTHIIDLYEVTCGTDTVDVFLDMYHCADPDSMRAVGPFAPSAP